jgi:hypothetical protein
MRTDGEPSKFLQSVWGTKRSFSITGSSRCERSGSLEKANRDPVDFVGQSLVTDVLTLMGALRLACGEYQVLYNSVHNSHLARGTWPFLKPLYPRASEGGLRMAYGFRLFKK